MVRDYKVLPVGKGSLRKAHIGLASHNYYVSDRHSLQSFQIRRKMCEQIAVLAIP